MRGRIGSWLRTQNCHKLRDAAVSGQDPLEQLRKLAELRDAGVITPVEFETKKSELLMQVGRPIDTTLPTMSRSQPNNTRLTEEPVVLTLASAAILSDDDLVGKVTPSDLANSQGEAHRQEQTLRQEEKRLTETQSRLTRLRFQSQLARSLMALRSFLSSTPLGRLGSAVIFTTLLAGLAVVLAGSFSSKGQLLLMSGMIAVICGTLLAVVLLFVPSDSSLTTKEKCCHDETEELKPVLEQCLTRVEAARASYEQAGQRSQRLQRIVQSRKHRLLISDWRMLRGIPFEDFLQEVFEDLGYHVERTKASGDQGADLILNKNGTRTAVQAKGLADSVGNGAVQEAHAGMAFYECHRCIVVTNSVFTSSAMDLARRINCVLIAGNHIPDLIRGKIPL
jgi:HJR/Mrr/RecB family endonuclease